MEESCSRGNTAPQPIWLPSHQPSTGVEFPVYVIGQSMEPHKSPIIVCLKSASVPVTWEQLSLSLRGLFPHHVLLCLTRKPTPLGHCSHPSRLVMRPWFKVSVKGELPTDNPCCPPPCSPELLHTTDDTPPRLFPVFFFCLVGLLMSTVAGMFRGARQELACVVDSNVLWHLAVACSRRKHTLAF